MCWVRHCRQFCPKCRFQDIVHVDTVPCAIGNIQRQAALKRADKLFSGFAARGQVDDRVAVAAEAVEAEQVLQQRLDLMLLAFCCRR